jgi:2-oxoisovalerate dehydrogenase E1 component alpha subunit
MSHLSLYQAALTSRLLEEKMVTLQRNGYLSTYAGCSGQEILYAGIGITLGHQDVYVPYYRDQPCLLLRGYQFIDFMRYWGGDERGNLPCNPDLPICVPIATQCLHAAGVAFAQKQKGNRCITVVTLGDGATSKGDFYEAMNFAAVHELPIVFVINDNGWAISTPIQKQTRAFDFTLRAKALGLNTLSIDGTDANAVITALENAYAKARTGNPILIQAKTVRLCDHTTADDAKRYKPEGLLAKELEQDGLIKLYDDLCQKKHWSATEDQTFRSAKQADIQAAIEIFLNEPGRHPQVMHNHTLNTKQMVSTSC